MERHTIATATHGAYLTSAPEAAAPELLLVGFHGQSETAAVQMAHLERIRGGRPWLLMSVQGLHRYYTRRGDVAAAWMTREDRELAIADNLAYVRAVMARVAPLLPEPRRVVYVGFSQGTAMAYRTAAFVEPHCSGLVILGGDLPPDVVPDAGRLPPVLLGRGTGDAWYTAEKAASDRAHLSAAGVAVSECVFDGGHERAPEFEARARAFLDDLVNA